MKLPADWISTIYLTKIICITTLNCVLSEVRQSNLCKPTFLYVQIIRPSRMSRAVPCRVWIGETAPGPTLWGPCGAEWHSPTPQNHLAAHQHPPPPPAPPPAVCCQLHICWKAVYPGYAGSAWPWAPYFIAIALLCPAFVGGPRPHTVLKGPQTPTPP